jgi:TetR/AcrR family transcriptional repressor of lmrAB and yxaGH operons
MRNEANAAATGTREKLIATAISLMRRSGLSGAGINEIVRESGAPKGSVYYFFPGGKQQIVEEGLALYSESVAAFIDSTLASKQRPGDKVKALFNAFAERIERGDFRYSCPAGTVCLDLDSEVEGLRIVVAASFDQYLRAIERHLSFLDRRRAKSFAGLLLTAIEGAYVRGRADRSGRPFREAGVWLAELAERAGPPPAHR